MSNKSKSNFKLSDADIELLNSRLGMKYLFAPSKVDMEKIIRRVRFEYELRQLQAELVHLQTWMIEEGKKVVVIFEGRDAAGKGGAIRRITAHMNPRYYRIVALPKPTFEEEGQWYFQRYVNLLPKPGEMVLFDRSWYNRAIVEPVNAFCSPHDYEIFMGQVNEFERMIVESDTYLIKFYFSITKEEQARRFAEIKSNPLKKWKMTPVDERAQELWDQYTAYKQRMFEHTNTDICPWVVIEANLKTIARVESIKFILSFIPYQKPGQN